MPDPTPKGTAASSSTCDDPVLTRPGAPLCGRPAKWVTRSGLHLCGTHARSWRLYVPASPLTAVVAGKPDETRDPKAGRSTSEDRDA